jgi:peptide deformylase
MDPEFLSSSSTSSEERDLRDADSFEVREVAYPEIRLLGDPVLKTRAQEVEHFDEALRTTVKRLSDLIDVAPLYGLSANQIGVLHRVFVYHVEQDDPHITVVNPVIEWASEKTETQGEACFSLPDIVVHVERPVAIRLRAFDEYGVETVRELSGIEARVVQHETDHLNGTLITDRATTEERRTAMRMLRERLTRF